MTNRLQPALPALDAEIASVFDVLGLTVGGADITILSLETDQPAPLGRAAAGRYVFAP